MAEQRELTIHEVKDTILRWINTCNKVEQIDQMAVWVVEQFIVNRFEKTESALTVQIIKEFLTSEMEEQKVAIKRTILNNSFNYKL